MSFDLVSTSTTIHFIYYLCFLFLHSILDRLTLGQILAIAHQYYFCNLIVIDFLSFIISLRTRIFNYFIHCSVLTPCTVPTYSTVKIGCHDINLAFFNLDYILRSHNIIVQFTLGSLFDILICYFEHLHFFSFSLFISLLLSVKVIFN